MEAKPKFIAEVLRSADKFLIPYYQRPYVWTKEQVDQIWNDIWEGYQEAFQDQVLETDETYFLGPIVVVKDKDRETSSQIAHLVDGQQRMTTLIALLWSAFNISKNSNSVKVKDRRTMINSLLHGSSGKDILSVARDDVPNFDALRNNGQIDETSLFGKAIKLLRDKLMKVYESDEEHFAEFIRFFLHHVQLIYIETNDFSTAWDLFIGINSRGIPLNPADLIKAYICGVDKNGDHVAQVWDERVRPLENDATSCLAEIYRFTTGEHVADAKLFDRYKKLWEKPDKSISLTIISTGCESYRRLWRRAGTENVTKSLSPWKYRLLRSLNRLGRRDHSSLFMAIAEKHGYDAIFNDLLLEAIEAYQFRMSVTRKRGREREFAKLAHEVFSNNYSVERIHYLVCDKLLGLKPSDDEVKYAILNLTYPSQSLKSIVLEYEEGLRADAQLSEIEYEHLVPQKGTEFWFKVVGTSDRNQYWTIVNNIGNIFPIDKTTNIQGKNDDFAVKKDLYQEKIPNWLISQTIRNLAIWNKENIEQRANELMEWAMNKRWNLQSVFDKAPKPTEQLVS